MNEMYSELEQRIEYDTKWSKSLPSISQSKRI